MTSIDAILNFWFEGIDRSKWFAKDASLDRLIKARFEDSYRDAAAGAFDFWRRSGRGCVALCVLLDQFPRNMYRNRAEAFATDELALAVTHRAIGCGLDLEEGLSADFRHFLYMPLMHSERIADQRLCVELMRTRVGDGEVLKFAERHLRIIERFGRFPHRNVILGRQSTPAEHDFLKTRYAAF